MSRATVLCAVTLLVSVNGSAPQWFILDTGNNTTSILARECADRLNIARGNEARADVGGGAGADVPAR